MYVRHYALCDRQRSTINDDAQQRNMIVVNCMHTIYKQHVEISTLRVYDVTTIQVRTFPHFHVERGECSRYVIGPTSYDLPVMYPFVNYHIRHCVKSNIFRQFNNCAHFNHVIVCTCTQATQQLFVNFLGLFSFCLNTRRNYDFKLTCDQTFSNLGFTTPQNFMTDSSRRCLYEGYVFLQAISAKCHRSMLERGKFNVYI